MGVTIYTGNDNNIIQGNIQGNSQEVGNFVGRELVLATWW